MRSSVFEKKLNCHFEYFQLYTTGNILLLWTNFISVNMLVWSALTNMDFGIHISYLVPFSRQVCFLDYLLSTIETIILRYFTEFVWKRIPPLDQNFTVLFLNIVNIMLAVFMATTLLFIGGGQEIFRLQGYPSFLKRKPAIHPQ